MPSTVPNSPTNGDTFPTVASADRYSSSCISCRSDICRRIRSRRRGAPLSRNSASVMAADSSLDNTRRYVSAKRSAMGLFVIAAARRRISLGSSSDSNAVRKRRSCERIDRNNLNLYRITAQEKIEKVSSRNRTAWVIGLAILIRSSRSARPVTRVSSTTSRSLGPENRPYVALSELGKLSKPGACLSIRKLEPVQECARCKAPASTRTGAYCSVREDRMRSRQRSRWPFMDRLLVGQPPVLQDGLAAGTVHDRQDALFHAVGLAFRVDREPRAGHG